MNEKIKNVFEAIANGDKKIEFKEQYGYSEEELLKEVDFINSNQNELKDVVAVLFQHSTPLASDFFETVTKLQSFISFNKKVYELMGKVSVEVFKRLKAEDVNKLLYILLEKTTHQFWSYLHVLPHVLSDYNLPPEFASEWFLMISDKIKNDLAGGDFYKGVENYVSNFPESGLTILEKYISEDLLDERLNLASNILGTVRAIELYDIDKLIKFENLDKLLIESPKEHYRVCYYSSWVQTYIIGKVTIEKLDELLKEMLRGTPKVVEQAYSVAYRCIFKDTADETYIKYISNWLVNNTKSTLTPNAKYYIIESLWRISSYSVGQKKKEFIGDLNRILNNILPISNEFGGIWHTLENYLVDLLKLDVNCLWDALLILNTAEHLDILSLIKEDKLNYLLNEIKEIDSRKFIFDLFLSDKTQERNLGFLLFAELPFDTYENLDKITIPEKKLWILLYEFESRSFLGEQVSKYLILIEPFFRNTCEELKNEFLHEMFFQAVNFPGICLESWKNLKGKSDILNKVIVLAENYFERLNEVNNSPLNSFCSDEIVKAEIIFKREMSRKISKDVEEKSIFLKLVRKTNILYGDKWSITQKNMIGDPSNFGEFSQSFEFPRIEIIDPEGMFLKRMDARIKLKDLTSNDNPIRDTH